MKRHSVDSRPHSTSPASSLLTATEAAIILEVELDQLGDIACITEFDDSATVHPNPTLLLGVGFSE